MLNFILYVLAVVVGLMLIFFYEPKDEKECLIDDPEFARSKKKVAGFKLSSLWAVLGLNIDSKEEEFEAFSDHFTTFDEVSEACRRAGLEASNLIIGVDFTASNEWQGRKSFGQNCLHKLSGSKIYNPYQKVRATPK